MNFLSIRCKAFVIVFLPIIVGASFTSGQKKDEGTEGTPSTKSSAPWLKGLKIASKPPRLFVIPTARVLNTMEVSFSGWSVFGVEGGGSLLGKLDFGLGNVAEIEFTTSGVVNRLTARSTSLPTSTFKVALIPPHLNHRWWVPHLALQLRSSAWRSLADRRAPLRPALRTEYAGKSLIALNLDSRFTTLYCVVSKNGSWGEAVLGYSLTDVRTRRGVQWIFEAATAQTFSQEIEELKKNIIAPLGGMAIRVNPNTKLMAEIEAIPMFDYDIVRKEVVIKRAWLGIAGVRFFVAPFFSVDVGVKYQSNYDGIADSEINLGLNLVVPMDRML